MARTRLVKGSGDVGLFGPGSVTWRIHADPIMIVGGLRALLVQALDPRTMAGVAQHSNYRNDSWQRLNRTTDYVMATTYGDTAAAEAAARIVRKVHDRVHGIDPVTGRAYSANDPDLLLWVHAAEVESFVTVYRRLVGRLSDSDADRYVAEMVRAAEVLGVPSGDVPRTLAGLRAYIAERDLIASPYAMDAMRFILYPPVPWPGGRPPEVPGRRLLLASGRAGYSLYSLGTIALLPTRIRRMYRLPPVPLTPPLRAALLALSRAMRMVFPPPPIVAEALARRRDLEAA